MKIYRKSRERGKFAKFIDSVFFPDFLDGATERGTWGTIVAGVVTAGVGYVASQKKERGNKALAQQAIGDENARRAAAAGEAEKAIAAYNQLREERPGLTFREWANERIQALNDPALKEAFRKTKREDFEEAQLIANLASQGNVNTFEAVIDRLSGGKAIDFLKKRNDLALNADTASAYKRALELQSPTIPAGTVRYDQSGRLVGGQRGEKQQFRTAYEETLKGEDRQFRMLRDVLNDDRSLADRHTERAKDFLPFAGYTDYASNLSDTAMKTRLAFQMQDEQNQFQLIRDFSAAAMTDQTRTPQFASTAGSDALTAAGIDLAVKGIANYASRGSGGYQQTTTSVPYYTDGVETRRALTV